jgi:uncharacterized membrane-anchored protein
MKRHDLARRLLGCVVVLGVLAAPLLGSSQQAGDAEIARQMQALAWQRGPTAGSIGGIATIAVPQGQAFLDGPNTRRFLELNGNPPRDNRYTLVGPEGAWFAVFFFEDSGYVKDDETLDPDALLTSLQESDQPANDERKRLGLRPLHTDGWVVPPHYDAATKRLEWGLRLRGDDGRLLVNYTIRLLGRQGVMHAILVSDPESLDREIAEFKTALAGYDFTAGHRYAEFRAGDRVAEYGLAALVLGGAAAVATKTGFLKAFGKLIVVGVVALGAAVTTLFRKLFRQG